MPGAIRRANNAKSKIRARVEHVFAAQKDRMDLFIRTIGIARRPRRSAWPISSTTSNGYCVCVDGWPRSAPNAAADRKITSPMRRRSTKHHPNIAEIVQSAQHLELLEVSSCQIRFPVARPSSMSNASRTMRTNLCQRSEWSSFAHGPMTGASCGLPWASARTPGEVLSSSTLGIAGGRGARPPASRSRAHCRLPQLSEPALAI